jgi:hypothetical protein
LAKKQVSPENALVAVNAVRARLTILGFNLAIITFQIGNTRSLGAGSSLEGFQTTVHLSTGTVLLIGVALSIASMVVFIASSMLDREGTCDRRMILTGDLLMYLALAQTVSGFFGSYERILGVMSMPAEAEQGALFVLRSGVLFAGSAAWVLATYVGPMMALVRSYHHRAVKLLHATAYSGSLVYVSHLWWAAERIEGRSSAGPDALSAWFSAFAAPLFW